MLFRSLPPEGARNSIHLRIGDVAPPGRDVANPNEAYVLTIAPDSGIDIVGRDAAGVFYAIQSLRNWLPIEAYRGKHHQLTLDAARISDAPRFNYRGMHLDVARNFQSKQTVEKLLDVMAFYKLNRLHLHLTDDEGWRIEITALPELTNIGGYRGHTLDELDHLIPSQGSGAIADPKVSVGSGFYSQDD